MRRAGPSLGGGAYWALWESRGPIGLVGRRDDVYDRSVTSFRLGLCQTNVKKVTIQLLLPEVV
jgi:hypothetical protein